MVLANIHLLRLAQSRLSDHDSLPDTNHWLQIYQSQRGVGYTGHSRLIERRAAAANDAGSETRIL